MKKTQVMHEGDRISGHEVDVYRFLVGRGAEWSSNVQIARALPGVAERTIRAHTRQMAAAGVLEVTKTFPEFIFRVSARPAADADYAARLRAAAVAIEEWGHG